jgi:hypothetical protein
MEDEITKQDKGINNDSVNDQDIAPTGEKPVHKDNSSRKLKNYTSIDRSTEEVDHREMKDPKPMKEENIKHKVKKKKKTFSNDRNIHDIQYNLEEIPVDSCNSEKCEEHSVMGETSVSVNCKNEENAKRKKRKQVNKICAGVELECKKDEILQEQVDTETNRHNLNTARHI